MKKILYIALALVIIAGGYYFYDQSHKRAMAPADNAGPREQSQANNQPAPTTAQTPEQAASSTTGITGAQNSGAGSGASPQAQFSSGEEVSAGSDVQVVEIDYDGSKFTPDSVNINVNDWVFFKNNSSVDFWPASNPHPVHTGYPGFDAGKPIGPGQTYKFQFAKAGTWGFHNHLNPAQQGVVNVK